MPPESRRLNDLAAGRRPLTADGLGVYTGRKQDRGKAVREDGRTDGGPGMARRGRLWGSWRSWVFPTAGAGTVLGLALVPGLPFSAGRWPLGGAFGAFTWAAWGVSTALAVSLFLLGCTLYLRTGMVGSRPSGRVLWGAVGFALLAVLAYAAAAKSDLIERRPLAALGLALAALAAMRRLALAVADTPTSQAVASKGRDDGQPAEAVSQAPDEPRRSASDQRPPLAKRPVPDPGDGDDAEGEIDDAAARWSRRLATAMAAMLVMFVAAGTAIHWLGPGLGIVWQLTKPTPIFWGEPAFFEYESLRNSKGDPAPYRRDPAPGSPDEGRRAVLPAGAKLVIKGWVEGGAEVRIEYDPGGKLAGEWGYVRVNDLTE